MSKISKSVLRGANEAFKYSELRGNGMPKISLITAGVCHIISTTALVVMSVALVLLVLG